MRNVMIKRSKEIPIAKAAKAGRLLPGIKSLDIIANNPSIEMPKATKNQISETTKRRIKPPTVVFCLCP